MAVGYTAESESHTGVAGNTGSPNPFTWSHSGGASDRWAVVFVFTIASATQCTGVTYGGAAMTAVPYVGFDTDTEPGGVQAWFRDNIATGTQTVSVSRSGTSAMYAVCFTGTAASATEIGPNVYTQGGSTANTNASSTGTGTGSPAAISINDGSPGSNSLRLLAQHYGGSSVLTANADSTAGPSIDYGLYVNQTFRETTPSQGAKAIGTATTTADDRGTIGLAVRETPASTGTKRSFAIVI